MLKYCMPDIRVPVIRETNSLEKSCGAVAELTMPRAFIHDLQ